MVSTSYKERAEKYIRLDGKLGFSAGSGAGDVFEVIREHGIVPNAEMTGMNYGTPLPQQAEMDAVLLSYVEAVSRNTRTLSTHLDRVNVCLHPHLCRRSDNSIYKTYQ